MRSALGGPAPTPPAFDPVSAIGIGGLALVVGFTFAWMLTRGAPGLRRQALLAVAGLLAGSAAVSVGGVLARFDVVPPPMAVMIVTVLAGSLALGASTLGAHAAATVPLATLIGLQAFRLPLELLMHRAGTAGIMPPELSYSGYNFDIVTGATALMLWAALNAGWRVPRRVLWAWNLWGVWCLTVIVFVAVASSPMVRFFGDDRRHVNTWVLFFPYVWLPVVLVSTAIAGHVIVGRALARERPVTPR